MPFIPVGTFSAYSNIVPSGNGYFCQGYQSGGGITTSAKLNFLTESLSTTSSTFTASTSFFNSSVSNIGTAGYVSKGRNGTDRGVEKLLFSTDSISQLSNTLSTASYGMATITNNGVAGYFGGGTAGGRVSTAVDKVSYSTDTGSISTSLINGNYYISAFSNYPTAGYFTNVASSVINKNSFPTDTMSSISFSSTFQEYNSAYFSNNNIAGYTAGGGGTPVNKIIKYSFTSETGFQISAVLSQAKNYVTGISHTQVAGYVGGGYTTGVTFSNTIEKISFNSDTISTLSATLSTARSEMCGLSNGGII